MTIDVQGVPVLIDEADAERVLKHRWHWSAGRAGMRYAMAGKLYLHRFIIGAQPGEMVDHINRDRADNRRTNLRIVGHKESVENRGLNRNNTTGIKGVSPWRGRYRATRNGKHLGVFMTKAAAAAAYEAVTID